MAWRLLRRGRQPKPSRPRVTSAMEAARSAQSALTGGCEVIPDRRASGGLGSAQAGAAVLLTGNAMLSGGARPAGAVLGASPAVLLAAARASNRSVEDVWEEALTAWIMGGDEALEPRPTRRTLERRHLAWHEIDQTLGALRAG